MPTSSESGFNGQPHGRPTAGVPDRRKVKSEVSEPKDLRGAGTADFQRWLSRSPRLRRRRDDIGAACVSQRTATTPFDLAAVVASPEVANRASDRLTFREPRGQSRAQEPMSSVQ